MTERTSTKPSNRWHGRNRSALWSRFAKDATELGQPSTEWKVQFVGGNEGIRDGMPMFMGPHVCVSCPSGRVNFRLGQPLSQILLQDCLPDFVVVAVVRVVVGFVVVGSASDHVHG